MRLRRGGLVLVLLVAVLVGPTTGCSCIDGPYLAQDAEGRLAIGWEADEHWSVTSVVLLDGEQVRWQITSPGAPPEVIVLGEAPTAFVTAVPLVEPLAADTAWSLRVDYTSGRGNAGTFVVDDISDPLTRTTSEARVAPEADCSSDMSLDLGAIAGFLGGMFVALAMVVLFMLLGVLGLLWIVRAGVRSFRRPQGPPVI